MGHDLRRASSSEPESTDVKGISLRLPKVYPKAPLCQRHNRIMPEITDSNSEALIDTAVYPEFELYHPVSVDETGGPITVTPISLYPRMRICMSP